MTSTERGAVTSDSSGVTVEDIRAAAVLLLAEVDEGDRLDQMTEALIGLAVRASATTLDMGGTQLFARRALDAGATGPQVHETLVLVSGVGVHTLMEGSGRVGQILRELGDPAMTRPLDQGQAQLWAQYVGSDPYWDAFEREVPGFLDALLRLSPEAFKAYFEYCAVPWRTGALRAVTKELIAMAVDAMPSHRYMPGMRLHLMNAAGLGVGRAAILDVLDIAAAAPTHRGLR